MDHKHLSTDYSLKELLNIIGGMGAISNINYHSAGNEGHTNECAYLTPTELTLMLLVVNLANTK